MASEKNNFNDAALRFSLTVEMENILADKGSQVKDEKSVAYFQQSLAYAAVPVWREAEYKSCMLAAAIVIAEMEPGIFDGDSDTYTFYHNTGRRMPDSPDGRQIIIAGKNGNSLGVTFGKYPISQDRPVLFYNKEGSLSLLDISDEWFDTGAMSLDYINSLKPIMSFMSENEGRKWTDCFKSSEDKFENFYLPVLDALRDEIEYQCRRHPNASASVVKHFFGTEDYYLVSLQSKIRRGKVSAYGPNGKLNAGTAYADELLPSELISVDYKERATSVSNTTLQLIFNNGWQVQMRLRTTDAVVRAGALRLEVDFKGSKPYKLRSKEFRW